MKKLALLSLGLCIGVISLGADDGAAALCRAERAVTDVMVHDIFSPPVAARIYLYTSLAAYETLVKAYPAQYQSLNGQVRMFPRIPDPRQKVSYSLAAVYAFLLVGKNLVFSRTGAGGFNKPDTGLL